MITRVQPPRCETCGTLPQQCPTCEDYACKCPVPWMAQREKRGGSIIPRAHYDKTGKPYKAQFIDGAEHATYPDEEEDLKFLIEQ